MGGGFIFFFSRSFALGLTVDYDTITDTPYHTWIIAPTILLSLLETACCAQASLQAVGRPQRWDAAAVSPARSRSAFRVSWDSVPARSIWTQYSTMRPPAARYTALASSVTGSPVGAWPSTSPR